MKFPLLAKVGAVVLVGLMILVVLTRIEGLVAERKGRGDEAVRSVEHSHAAAQAVVGPLLQRGCVEEWDVATGTGKDRSETTNRRVFTLQEVPTRLAIDGRTRADPLYRGLFKVNTYIGHLDVAADFANLASLQPHAEHTDGRLQCGAPVLMLALSDVRGVRSATVVVDGQALAVAPGTPNEKYSHGLHATLASARADGDAAAKPLSAKLTLDVIGTSQLAWVPAADNMKWTLTSDWPHPSFGGQFVPEQRDVRQDGFSATWNLSALATTAPADVAKGLELCAPSALGSDADGGGRETDGGDAKSAKCLDLVAVAFIDPVNPYVLSDRAVKYDLLFIALTFIAVGLIEVLSGRRVHPVQYLLVGLALSVFFLLLLSLSEHLVFETAYAAASLACAALLGFYASSMLGRKVAGLMFGTGIAMLYGLLYVLLQMEQNALVIGSVMLFAGLASVMMLTRRIDWYALFARLRSNADAPPAQAVPVGGDGRSGVAAGR
jgi:inner membrane protein